MAVYLTADQREALAAGATIVAVKLTDEQRSRLLDGEELTLSAEAQEVEFVALNRNSGAIVHVVDDASGNTLRYRVLRWAGGNYNLSDEGMVVLRSPAGQRFRESSGWVRARMTP